jgi:hypothetical protein
MENDFSYVSASMVREITKDAVRQKVLAVIRQHAANAECSAYVVIPSSFHMETIAALRKEGFTAGSIDDCRILVEW